MPNIYIDCEESMPGVARLMLNDQGARSTPVLGGEYTVSRAASMGLLCGSIYTVGKITEY
jgi:hypothetical protein